jgi:glutamate receptor ionotropic, NMDA 3A
MIQMNITGGVKKKCCTGYMINLLKRLSIELNFDFDLYFVPDMKIGHRLDDTNPNSKWNGAMNHVISGIAHIAAGPYSITEDRLKVIDFTVPYLYSSYSIVTKQVRRGVKDLAMFMKPFPTDHWLLIGLCGFLSAFSLALLEFNSPFGLNPKGRQRARNYTLGSAISTVISLMFMHTMPAKSPKSWAGKWTQNFIASFALIFIATYTAQMASILSAGRDSVSFDGIDDVEVNLKLFFFLFNF